MFLEIWFDIDKPSSRKRDLECSGENVKALQGEVLDLAEPTIAFATQQAVVDPPTRRMCEVRRLETAPLDYHFSICLLSFRTEPKKLTRSILLLWQTERYV